jgi:CBS domain-containing protein
MRTVEAILDVANSVLCTIESTVTVGDAVAQMSELDVSSLLVVDHKSKIIGLFTEHDVLVHVAAEKDLHSVTVVEVMTEGLVTVSPGASLEEAMELMNGCNHERLVVTECGEICGLVSRAEISRYLMRDRDALIDDLTYYITH